MHQRQVYSLIQYVIVLQIDCLEDFNILPDRLTDMLVNSGFTKQLLKANKGSAMMSLMIHSLITSRKAELDQFAFGLGPVLKAAQKQPSVCKPLFVFEEGSAMLTPEIFKELLSENDLEDRLKAYFHDYIDSRSKNILLSNLHACRLSKCIKYDKNVYE